MTGQALDLAPFLDENSDLPTETRLHLFVQMCDHKMLLERIQFKALMIQMEMDTPDPLPAFVLAILRIAKPHLFDLEGNLHE